MNTLRDVSPSDHTALAAMRGDAALMAALMIDPAESATEPVEEWIARRQALGRLWVVADTGKRTVGFVQLTGFHRRNATAWLGIAIARHEQAKGHGRRALASLCDMSPGLGLRKLKLEVRADNATAIALYHALGFRDVGRLEAEFDDGQRLHDTLIMERLLQP